MFAIRKNRLFQGYGLQNLTEHHRESLDNATWCLSPRTQSSRENGLFRGLLYNVGTRTATRLAISFRPSLAHLPQRMWPNPSLSRPPSVLDKMGSNMLGRVCSSNVPPVTCLHRFINVPLRFHHPSNNSPPNSSSPSSKTSIPQPSGYSAAASHEHGRPSSTPTLRGATNTTPKRRKRNGIV